MRGTPTSDESKYGTQPKAAGLPGTPSSRVPSPGGEKGARMGASPASPGPTDTRDSVPHRPLPSAPLGSLAACCAYYGSAHRRFDQRSSSKIEKTRATWQPLDLSRRPAPVGPGDPIPSGPVRDP
ncbi:hypothetical protein A1Q2_01824 [Trichosporon asahii var. asahii CBS 8904]|uniref:Uncharacterized protein n=2 Tax=Trichosporon asahii var. asahii TaxID=189963 RepID=K1VTC7_TRIAC|nr:hypothetical protein A1Q1_04408 [Trichosporon asahii var. asahii CBS 2479]EJT46857.1 hypothetical protein A1Q1_04408 [Trichosporon asahii var. asahii CBS 2479]EKD03811.1 hypothetical protein A1Q2_01824 [Trichosporon asahii var. asahii CBS 8904]